MPENLGNFSSNVVFSCANAALKKGYRAFGIQNVTQCWTGPWAHTLYHKHGNCSGASGEFWLNRVYLIVGRYLLESFV